MTTEVRAFRQQLAAQPQPQFLTVLSKAIFARSRPLSKPTRNMAFANSSLAQFFTEFDPNILFLFGALCQMLLAFIFPVRVASIPLLLLLVAHAMKFARLSKPVAPAQQTAVSSVLKGRYTAQIPHSDGSATQKGAEDQVVCFIIGASVDQYVNSDFPYHPAPLSACIK